MSPSINPNIVLGFLAFKVTSHKEVKSSVYITCVNMSNSSFNFEIKYLLQQRLGLDHRRSNNYSRENKRGDN